MFDHWLIFASTTWHPGERICKRWVWFHFSCVLLPIWISSPILLFLEVFIDESTRQKNKKSCVWLLCLFPFHLSQLIVQVFISSPDELLNYTREMRRCFAVILWQDSFEINKRSALILTSQDLRTFSSSRQVWEESFFKAINMMRERTNKQKETKRNFAWLWFETFIVTRINQFSLRSRFDRFHRDVLFSCFGISLTIARVNMLKVTILFLTPLSLSPNLRPCMTLYSLVFSLPAWLDC